MNYLDSPLVDVALWSGDGTLFSVLRKREFRSVYVLKLDMKFLRQDLSKASAFLYARHAFTSSGYLMFN
jgi:hypothetical protein